MGKSKKWKLNTNEVGKSCGDNKGNTFKVYVAKVLPLIKFAKPKEKPVTLSKTCFINATKCKPSISTTIKTCNYLLISTDHISKNVTSKVADSNSDAMHEIDKNTTDALYAIASKEDKPKIKSLQNKNKEIHTKVKKENNKTIFNNVKHGDKLNIKFINGNVDKAFVSNTEIK